MRLSGVVAVGVGLASGGEEQAAIQVFVEDAADEVSVMQEARSLLGQNRPIEVLHMPIPQAQEGNGEGGIDGN